MRLARLRVLATLVLRSWPSIGEVAMSIRTVLLIPPFAAICLALGSQPAQVTAQSLTPVESETALIERLANLAPVVDSRRDDLKSVAVRWRIWGDFGELRAECAYVKPDQRACTVSHDAVPLLIAVGPDIFAYGPVNGPRLLRGDWQVCNCDLQGRTTGDLLVGWKILNPGHSQAGVLLDLRSLVTRADRERTVSRLGENRFMLRGRTENGGVLEAWIDLSNPARYSRLTARSADDTGHFELEALVVDGNIRPDFLRFPSLQGKLNLGPPTSVGFDNLGEIVQQVLLSSFLRLPVKYPGGRKDWEANMSQVPDWQRLEAQDAALAPILRDILQDFGHP
jgi:hypothetical protein